MVLRFAGEIGQECLARSADDPGARAAIDQHAAEIRAALAAPGQQVTAAALLSYTRGFAEVIVARGWTPAHRQERDPWADEPPMDWTSLRVAAICRLFLETQGLAIAA
jgi:hypothetical protein